MLLATPARSAQALPKALAILPPVTPKLTLSEADLASRWSMSPKTLQRWRMEGRGPIYLKMGKRVNYSLNAVIAFESCIQHVSTSQRDLNGGGSV